jgi:ubiquitin-conjugating enzyme E2 variant
MTTATKNDNPTEDWFSMASQTAAWLFAAVSLLLAIRLTLRMEWWEFGIVLAAAPVAWAVADLLTGMVHWGLDTYGDPETPFIGPNFIEPFRQHHHEPEAMLDISGAENVGSAAMLALPAQIGLVVASAAGLSHWIVALGSICIVGTVLTNLFHRWSHMESPPDVARVLQEAGLILGRVEHERHHTGEHDTAYCITSGWMNRPLERVAFFARLERVLSWVGIEPHRSTGRH